MKMGGRAGKGRRTNGWWVDVMWAEAEHSRAWGKFGVNNNPWGGGGRKSKGKRRVKKRIKRNEDDEEECRKRRIWRWDESQITTDQQEGWAGGQRFKSFILTQMFSFFQKSWPGRIVKSEDGDWMGQGIEGGRKWDEQRWSGPLGIFPADCLEDRHQPSSLPLTTLTSHQSPQSLIIWPPRIPPPHHKQRPSSTHRLYFIGRWRENWCMDMMWSVMLMWFDVERRNKRTEMGADRWKKIKWTKQQNFVCDIPEKWWANIRVGGCTSDLDQVNKQRVLGTLLHSSINQQSYWW